MIRLMSAFICLLVLAMPAQAKGHGHHRHHGHHFHSKHAVRHYHHWRHHRSHRGPVDVDQSSGLGGRPSAWCGWEMRQLVGSDPGVEYNLARNWAHWGHAASGPAPGVIGVMPHHVFKVIQVLGGGKVLAISGNDGHAVRTRPRSTAGVIAWRTG